MLYYNILYYTILWYVILYYIILYYIILYDTILKVETDRCLAKGGGILVYCLFMRVYGNKRGSWSLQRSPTTGPTSDPECGTRKGSGLSQTFRETPYKFQRTWEFPPLRIKSLLESNPLKSKFLIGGLGVPLLVSHTCSSKVTIAVAISISRIRQAMP